MQTQAKKEIDTLISAQWIICVDDDNRVLQNYSVAIDQKLIIDILPTQEAKQIFRPNTQYDLPTHALIPGLINAHGHAAMTLLRGIANDLPLMAWLENYIWPAEGKWVNAQFVADGTRLAIAEMLAGGTTTFSDMYFFPESAARVCEEAGMRAQFCAPILDFPTAWGSGPDEYIAKAKQLNVEYKNHPLITIALGPHAPYTVSDPAMCQVLTAARDTTMPIQIHLHETQFGVEQALQNAGNRPIERLQKLGFFDSEFALQCVHMTALNEGDMSILADSNASVIHCPESNMKLASGFCPTKELLEHDVTLALGIDGAASNNDLDMFGELRTAALIAKGYSGDASAMNATQALRVATINGAKALGIDHTCGSLEIGKEADIAAINLDALNCQPSYDPLADIVYNCQANQVSQVWVAGHLKVNHGKLTELDQYALITTAKEWAAKIKEGMSAQ
jgi:5-methylthioadenosine/S-adenosylhomocysteine deaminase